MRSPSRISDDGRCADGLAFNPGPDGLYVIREELPQLSTPVAGVNALHFREWQHDATSFEAMGLLAGFEVNVAGGGEPERIHAGRASAGLLRALGARAHIGRTFTEEDEQAGRDRVVVLSDELWRHRCSSPASASTASSRRA